MAVFPVADSVGSSTQLSAGEVVLAGSAVDGDELLYSVFTGAVATSTHGVGSGTEFWEGEAPS
eukprot:4693784-Pyramimonas_sp.AAC.1